MLPVWQGRFKSPVIEDDDHLLTVLRYIEANPLRAKLVREAGAYPWSSFAAHGLGRPDPLVDPVPAYEALARTAKTRQRRWTKYVHLHQEPEDEELAAIRRSAATGLPLGAAAWVKRLGQSLQLDLTIRPRGRPRKTPGTEKGSELFSLPEGDTRGRILTCHVHCVRSPKGWSIT